MSARRRLADLYWGADFLDERRTDYPVTCTLMFVQAAAYALLRLWQEGYVPAFIDFDGLWAGSLLEGCVVVALAGLLPVVFVVVPMVVMTLAVLPGFVLQAVSARRREREQGDLDRLLDKVREGGIDHLSPGEAERLRQLSQRLRARRGA